MEPSPIRPLPPTTALPGVHNNGRGGSGGQAFERAFQEQTGEELELEAGAESSPASELQRSRAQGRRDQGAGEHRVDIVV